MSPNSWGKRPWTPTPTAAAKAEAIESSAKMEDLYLKAAKAMKSYQGQEDEEDEY